MRKRNLSIEAALFIAGGFGLFLSAAEATDLLTPGAAAAEDEKIESYKGVFKIINAGGPECKTPSEETQLLHDKYGAWHFCFTYKFKAEADFFTDVTNIVYDVMNIAIPITNYVELYQPTTSSIRFQVPEGKKYRLYEYWTHDIGNVPPPGKYTDHKFINIKDRSIDYWWKLKQRGTGKNARISGVAEVVFVPDEFFDKAKQDGFTGRK